MVGSKAMRNPIRIAAWLMALPWLLAAPALAQPSDYRFRPARVPVGQVMHYVKAQRDGAHEARISVYVAAVDRIESLKWDPGAGQATLVVASMDWSRFSVRAFEAWGLQRGAPPQRRATLDVEGDRLRMSLMPEPITLHHWPWHSYDFDFTSLTLTLPHRVDPRRELRFWRTDFVYADPPTVAELGEVSLRYVGRERRHGVKAWRYSVGGPGLQGTSGDWWVDSRTGLTLEYQLPVGDEPGYADVWLKLKSTEAMTPDEWAAFKLGATSGAPAASPGD